MTRPRRRYGVDASPVLGRPTGIGRVVAELVPRIAARLADDEEIVLVARAFRQHPVLGTSDATLRSLAARPRVRVVRPVLPASLAERIGPLVPSLALDRAAGPLDVFHGTNHWLPVTRARGVVTVHDLAALRFPGHERPAFVRRFRRVVTDAARRADAIVVPTDAVRRDVVAELGAAPERVVTIPHAAGAEFHAEADAARDADVVRRVAGARPYVLFVGTTRPRKNLARLLDAFAAARRSAALPHALVLAGDAGLAHDALRSRVARLGLGDDVRLAGRVSDDDLPALLRGAAALALPSLDEGFGLPVLEAFACGTPVLASDVPALREVAGGAAVLADPRSEASLAAALAQVLLDAPLRARLVAAGRTRAAEFSWESSAGRTLGLWRSLADTPRGVS